MQHVSFLFVFRLNLFAVTVLWLAVTLCGARAAEPAQTPLDLPRGETVHVTAVVDGDTVILDDKRQVRLVGLQAPKLPLGRRNFPTWPLAETSKTFMETLSLGRSFSLHYGGARIDRHGRILAHMVRDDGIWLQGAMLDAGLARVYTFPDNRALAVTMLAKERNARRTGRGIWALRYYQVLPAKDSLGRKNSFQLIQGRVLDVATVRGTTYLNFGPEWRTDFTVRISKKSAKLFTRSNIDLATLKGAEIRVRGWLKSRNGPMVELNHPEPLEVVTPVVSAQD